MKRLTAAILVGLILVLGGCGLSYDAAIQKGLDAVSKEDYSQAADYFKQAQETNDSDERATELLVNTMILKKADGYLNQQQYDQAIREADLVFGLSEEYQLLNDKAQKIREKAAVSVNASAAASGSPSSAESERSTDTSGESENNHSDSTSSAGSVGASSASSTGTAADPELQTKAEAAVAKAAGWSLQKVYVATVDEGEYYSIELRENHKATGDGDPNTAPSIGFFRYYKENGKITELDIASNEYKEIKQ